ncbi:MAG: hypothetical protein R3B51_14640 [Thermodesulfobacteriota bacterium]
MRRGPWNVPPTAPATSLVPNGPGPTGAGPLPAELYIKRYEIVEFHPCLPRV